MQIRTLTAFLWLLVCIEGKTQSDTTFFSDTTITIDTSFLKDTSLNISSDTAFNKLTCATFEEDIMPIFETYCNSSGCHGNGQSASRGNFTSYTGINNKYINGSLNNRVLIQKNMPPSGSLSVEELRLFQCWIDSLAPNTSADDIVYDTTISNDTTIIIDSIILSIDTTLIIVDTFEIVQDSTRDSLFIGIAPTKKHILETELYDLSGKKITTIRANENQPIPSGIYIFVIRYDNGTVERKKRWITYNTYQK